MGAFIMNSLHAATSSLVTQGDSTQDAADLRTQQQLQLESLIANAENEANRQKLDLQNQYAGLQVQLSKCGTDKSIASIQAQKDAEDKKASGTQNMIQQGAGSIAPLIQGGLGLTQMGTEKADEEIKEAVQNYNRTNGTPVQQVSTSSSKNSGGHLSPNPTPILECKTIPMSSDGSNVSSVISSANSKMAQNMPGTPTYNQNCYGRMAQLKSLAEEARETIRSAEKQKSKMKETIGSLVTGAGQLGLAVYGNSVAKKGAESDLNLANQMGDIGHQACADGIKSQAEAIQRQIDAINAQLAGDIDRLRKQFAAKRVEISPKDSNGLPVAEDTNVGVSELNGAGVPSSNFKSKNPLALDNKKNNSGGVAGGGAPGGAGAGGDGKLGWGFGNPSDSNNPGLYQGLPSQPGSASVSGGGEMGSGNIPSGENPFEDPLMPGTEDAFANVGPEGAKAGSMGNGFWELAMRTHRRVYAHLGELLGGQSGPQISNKENKNPERNISSTKN
jgi:hypothetical protein